MSRQMNHKRGIPKHRIKTVILLSSSEIELDLKNELEYLL